MGFFSDLKEDLSQAVNELLPEEAETEAVQESAAEETISLDDVDLSDMLEKMEAMELAEQTAEPVAEETDFTVGEEEAELLKAAVDDLPEEEIEEIEEPAAEEAETAEEIVEEPEVAAPVEEKEEKQEKKMETYMDTEQTEKRVATDETALITLGMTIRGDVETEGSLELIGKVIGNVDVLGKLNITGTIEGNSKASEVYAEKAHIMGEIVSEGAVKIGQNSVIIGNVYGNSAVVAGAVKGDIDIKGPVILDSTAIVMGNIRSKSVQINNGAVIEGMCSQCYADVTPTTFFDEFKNV